MLCEITLVNFHFMQVCISVKRGIIKSDQKNLCNCYTYKMKIMLNQSKIHNTTYAIQDKEAKPP